MGKIDSIRVRVITLPTAGVSPASSSTRPAPSSFLAATTAPSPLESRKSTVGQVLELILEFDRDAGVDPGFFHAHHPDLAPRFETHLHPMFLV